MKTFTLNSLPHLTFCLLLAALLIGSIPHAAAGQNANGRTNDAIGAGSGQDGVSLVSWNFSHTAAGNSATTLYTVSANERYIVFSSAASDLIPNDLNGTWTDIFRLDRETGQLELVTMNHAGTGSANFLSNEPKVSADGRYVAFMSAARDLVPNTQVSPAVYVRDMQTGITKAVSVNAQGTPVGGTHVMSISADGRYVVFLSNDTVALTGHPFNGQTHVFVRDTWANETRLVSINLSGSAGGNQDSGIVSGKPFAMISPDGRYVFFLSAASDLSGAPVLETLLGGNLFVRDLATNTTKVITGQFMAGRFLPYASDAVMSRNGRYVAYSAVPSLMGQPSNCYLSIVVYDVQTDSNTIVSPSISGSDCANNESTQPSISADGRFVAFRSFATDLVPELDHNIFSDIYVRDLKLGSTSLVSINRYHLQAGNGHSLLPFISADGRFVAYATGATDVTTVLDKNQQTDVVLYDLQARTSKLASSANPTFAGNGSSSYPWISSDGSFVLFNSAASDLAPHDTNQAYDLFLFTNGPGALGKTRVAPPAETSIDTAHR